MGGQRIEYSDTAKYLGLLLDRKLTCEKHVEEKCV